MVTRQRQPATQSQEREKGRTTPERTWAEEFYYRKQMASRTTMVVRMTDGEQLSGWIEWYDRDCFKLNRDDGPNLLVMKASVRYIHKQTENDEAGTAETAESETPRKPCQA